MWRQSWCELLFAHWPVAAERLQAHIPAPLVLETFDQAAWIGVVPFRMEGIARHPLPAVPGCSAFPELNVRTYVRYQDRPGVWFFSLDADHRFAVIGGRRWFHLPYHWAQMHIATEQGRVEYASRRRDGTASFRARYGPCGDRFRSRPGSLDSWLTERYSLFAVGRGHLWRADVQHQPWPLQPAEAIIDENRMLAGLELALPAETPHLLYAHRLDVKVLSPVAVTPTQAVS